MASVNMTIPDESLPRVVAALVGLYPIPKDEEGTPLYTQNQWCKQCVVEWMKKQVHRWEVKTGQEAARAAVTVPDNIVT